MAHGANAECLSRLRAVSQKHIVVWSATPTTRARASLAQRMTCTDPARQLERRTRLASAASAQTISDIHHIPGPPWPHTYPLPPAIDRGMVTLHSLGASIAHRPDNI